jgi:hypothetical protein
MLLPETRAPTKVGNGSVNLYKLAIVVPGSGVWFT